MAYAPLIATAKSSTGANNVVTTDAVDSTGCDLIVISVSVFNDPSNNAPTDSKGNTWSPLAKHGPGSTDVYNRLFYCESPIVGSGHTFSWDPQASPNSGGTYPCIQVQGFSGGTGTSFLSENGATANGVATLSTGSVTPSEDNCLVIAGLGIDVGTSITINGGFTEPNAEADGAATQGKRKTRNARRR